MKLVRQFAAFLWGTAGWQLVAAVALSMLLSLTEGISLAMIFPLIALLGRGNGGAGVAAGARTQRLFHLLASTHLPQAWWLPAILITLVVVVGLLAQLNGALSMLSLSIVIRTRQRLGDRLYRAMLGADWTFLTTRRSSDLTHLLTGELSRVGQVTSSLLELLANSMVALLMLALALYLAPLLTVLVLFCFALLLPWERRSLRRIHASGEKLSGHTQALFESSLERLGNLKVIKAYGAQQRELGRFSDRYGAAMSELMSNEWRRLAASRRFQIVSLLLLCAVILVGLNVLHAPPGTVLIFLLAFVRATPRLAGLQGKVTEMVADLPAYAGISHFLDECEGHHEQPSGVAPAPSLTTLLRLRDITFRYKADAPPVVDGLSLKLAAGGITAIAGPSGAGKSTVADLILGLLVPESGSIEVDGVALTRENAASWRSHVGYVSQDTLLFHASIRENLLWARPDATEADLLGALDAASAGFVADLPRGIETVVGDRGIALSHGQRQRIALARALLLEPTLLILDEATNSLDLGNEENILRTVAAQPRAMTTLLISHRPSAVCYASKVYVLGEGKVQCSGTWDEVRTVVETQNFDG